MIGSLLFFDDFFHNHLFVELLHGFRTFVVLLLVCLFEIPDFLGDFIVFFPSLLESNLADGFLVIFLKNHIILFCPVDTQEFSSISSLRLLFNSLIVDFLLDFFFFLCQIFVSFSLTIIFIFGKFIEF